MSADAPRQVFRPSPPNYVIGSVVVTFFVLLGLAFVLVGPSESNWVWPEIMGVFLLLVAAFGGRSMATSVLIATPAELVYWDWTRRRSLEWTEIRSFGVGRGRSRGGWPTVIIIPNTGRRIRTEVAAYRRSYPAQIAAELTALQRQYAPAPPAPGRDQSTVHENTGHQSPGHQSTVPTMGGVGALSLAAVLALAGIRIAQSARRSRLK